MEAKYRCVWKQIDITIAVTEICCLTSLLNSKKIFWRTLTSFLRNNGEIIFEDAEIFEEVC